MQLLSMFVLLMVVVAAVAGEENEDTEVKCEKSCEQKCNCVKEPEAEFLDCLGKCTGLEKCYEACEQEEIDRHMKQDD